MFELRLSGPGKNALSTVMMQHVLAQLDAAGGQPVLLTGEGDAFSAGLDLKEVASLDEAGMRRFLTLLERCMSALYLYPGPTVAAINGHAIAGGCVLALCCDRRVATATPRAKIGLNEVALGLRFPPRVLRIVRDRVPRRALEEVLLGAGLIDELADDVAAVARARLAALGAHPAQAYADTKRDLRGARDADLASDEAEGQWFRDALGAWTAPALKEKVRAMFSRA